MIKLNDHRDSVIPKLLNEIDAKVGVEIGVFKGQFSKVLMEEWNGTLYMIDPWRPLGEEYIDSSNHKDHLDAYEQATNSIRGFEDRAFMLRGLSEQMVKLFANNSLDFVYIDGNHAYDFVKQDMEMWWPKLKKGGLFCGHDYLDIEWTADGLMENGKDAHIWTNGGGDPAIDPYKYAGIFGVNPAVEEFCKKKKYEYSVTSEWTGTWHFIK
jgi:hypothetical protein